jgi:cysteine-rich repeat protein
VQPGDVPSLLLVCAAVLLTASCSFDLPLPGSGAGGSGGAASGSSASSGPSACTDGVVQAPEECDDGNQDDTDGCPTTCLWARCGDGHLRAGVEECEPSEAGDGCTSSCIDCAAVGSSRYASADNGHCYFQPGGETEWAVAQDGCANALGHLVTYGSSEEALPVRAAFPQLATAPSWIGLSDEAVEADFRWVTGEERVYTAGLEDNYDSRDCVAELPALRGGFTWQPEYCKGSAGYRSTCEIDGWILRPDDNHAYRVFYKKLVRDDARGFCENLAGGKGHLATLTSPEEYDFVAKQVILGARDAWIGLAYDPGAEAYLWLDGSPIDGELVSKLQETGRPADYGCVAHDGAGGADRWVTRACTDKGAFLCEVDGSD